MAKGQKEPWPYSSFASGALGNEEKDKDEDKDNDNDTKDNKP